MAEMRWFPDMATYAYCEAVQLRRILLEKRSQGKRSQAVASSLYNNIALEPGSAEVLSALAAGINSQHTLQVGCGLSTVALAVAARTTGSRLVCVHHDKEEQIIVQRFLKEFELSEFVEFVTGDAVNLISEREDMEFVVLSGLPEHYIKIFDMLKLKRGAIVVADNASNESTNIYIRHVKRQPGVDSCTLSLGRGLEITKITKWEDFQRRRKVYGGINDPINDDDYVHGTGTAYHGFGSILQTTFSSSSCAKGVEFGRSRYTGRHQAVYS